MTGRWIRRFTADPADRTPRLLCLPHAGGTATFFRDLARYLDGTADVLTVAYPGRQDRHREPAIDTVDGLVDAIAAALDAEVPGHTERPLVLLGHSMGAILAFELCRRLAPARLILSGRRAPSRPREERWPGSDAELLDAMRRMSGTDPRVLAHEDLLRLSLPAFRADVAAVRDHRPDPAAVVPVPITVLISDNDPTTSVDDAAAWAGHTTGGTHLEVFPGDHFHLRGWPAPQAAAVAGALAAARASDPMENSVTTRSGVPAAQRAGAR
ncbi:thioesterase II family protein [Streptomyces sp. BBFR2]|uniref:thioesterase II family protein n=1 Tax=Streptomyces sp. BBFR2 TaxID=3372854 RepID=UPI0037D9969F